MNSHSLTPIAQLAADQFADIKEFQGVLELSKEATAFLESHSWCLAVKEVWFDRGYSFLSIFLIEILPGPGADELVWVIVGDVPPAYIDTQTCDNGVSAVKSYIYCMREWCNAAKTGADTSELIPVYSRDSLKPIPATPKMFNLLERRLKFIEEEIMPGWDTEQDAVS